MEREQAERALAIIREVIENTKEDLVAHNWGAIWLIHAFTNSAAFASIGLFVERREMTIRWYLVPLAVVAAVNLAIVALLAERERGVRSFVEWQVHGIWVTFIAFTLGIAGILHLRGNDPALFCPLMAATSGIGFAMMGVVFYRRFFSVALAFLAIALAVSLPAVQPYQWYLMAAAWWAAMFVPGVSLFLEKRRRERHAIGTEIL